MKVQIDCYSKNLFAVQIDYAGRYPIEKGERGDLFLFVCYASKQFYNLGEHMVADALAGLLYIDPTEIMNKGRELQSGSDILIIKERIRLQAQGLDETEATLQSMSAKRELNTNSLVNILEKDFLSYIPNLGLKNTIKTQRNNLL